MRRLDLLFLWGCACVVLAAAFLLGKSAPSAPASPQVVSCRIEAGPLEPLSLSPGRLEPELSLLDGQIEGATITELPSPASGWLFFQGQPAVLYQSLTREELEQLVFVPRGVHETARVALILQCPDAPYALVQIATSRSGPRLGIGQTDAAPVRSSPLPAPRAEGP